MRIQELGFLTGYTQKQGAGPVLRPLPGGFSPEFGDLVANTEYRPGVGKKALEKITDEIPFDPRKLKAYREKVTGQARDNPTDLIQLMKWWRRTPKNPYWRTSPVRRTAFSNISPHLFTGVSSFLKGNPGYVANYMKTQPQQ